MVLFLSFLGLPFRVEAQKRNKSGEILAKFNQELSEAEIEEIVSRYGSSVEFMSCRFRCLYFSCNQQMGA